MFYTYEIFCLGRVFCRYFYSSTFIMKNHSNNNIISMKFLLKISRFQLDFNHFCLFWVWKFTKSFINTGVSIQKFCVHTYIIHAMNLKVFYSNKAIWLLFRHIWWQVYWYAAYKIKIYMSFLSVPYTHRHMIGEGII